MSDADWIKDCTAKISRAIGGGSELFVRHGDGFRLDVDFVCKRISEMRERHQEAMHRAIRAERKADGIELAARFVEKRLHDYVSEHGSTDPDTGTVEYPGNGEEYVYELEEIIEGIRELASPALPAPAASTAKGHADE